MLRPGVLNATILTVSLVIAAPVGSEPGRIPDLLQRLYGDAGNVPAWADNGYSMARQALQQLRDAGQHGLNPDDYAIKQPLPDNAERAPEQSARFERELSGAVLRFLSDIHYGRTAPDFTWFGGALERASFDPAAQLRLALRHRRLDEAITAAQPRSAMYHRVKQTLAHYRQLEPRYRQLPPLPALPAGGKLFPGAAYAGAADLAQRLVLLGDMPENAATTTEMAYYVDLAEGVKRFQSRHGLDPDGILGSATEAALKIPLSQRIAQLELTLERLRWMPLLPPGPLIVVNVPSYRLWALDTRTPSAVPQVEMRVIVGTAGRTPTPLFIAQLRHLEFNPYWNVPRSIEQQEIVPKLARDPDYLRKQDMELVGMNGLPDPATASPREALRGGKARVRQRPGPRNVLGAVKFAMPNPMSIYLHATSANELFVRQRRDMSHGCIRLEHPAELAEFLLHGDDGWDRASVMQAMEPGATRIVKLRKTVPVILLYATAVTDRTGRAMFLQDVYGLDQKLRNALDVARQPR